jgi:hypothetical protein
VSETSASAVFRQIRVGGDGRVRTGDLPDVNRACYRCTTSLCWLGWWESNPSSAVYQTAALIPLCYSPVVDQGGLEPPSAGCKPAALPLSYKPRWCTQMESNHPAPRCRRGACGRCAMGTVAPEGELNQDLPLTRRPLVLRATPARMATWTGVEPALPCSTDPYVDRYTTRSRGIARRTRTRTLHVRSVLLFR